MSSDRPGRHGHGPPGISGPYATGDRQPITGDRRAKELPAQSPDYCEPSAKLVIRLPPAGRPRGDTDDQMPEPGLVASADPEAASAHPPVGHGWHPGPLVLPLHPQPGRSGSDLHRQVVPRRSETVLQGLPPGVPYRGRHATRSRAVEHPDRPGHGRNRVGFRPRQVTPAWWWTHRRDHQRGAGDLCPCPAQWLSSIV